MGSTTRNAHPHRGSVAGLAVSFDTSSMEFDQLLDQGQADAGAFVSAGTRGAASKEPIKQPWEILSGYAATGVGNQ